MSSGRIVFMGTPQFAAPCLQQIIEDGYTVCGVFTQPDKPKGRGYKLTPPPVKELALHHNIPVFQPNSLKTDEVLQELRDLKPDVIVVVAYGKILPVSILELPPLGCVNIHASLLPKYRGAAPIQWSIINGDHITGVTSMYMAEGLDTGDMILKEELAIGPDETSGELHDRLSKAGSRVLSQTLQNIFGGTALRQPQTEEDSCYAPMLDKKIAQIDWGKSASTIHNLVRGLNPWPVAYSSLNGKKIKIYAVRPHTAISGASCGQVIAADSSYGLFVACEDGQIEVLQMQAEGGRKMTAREYLKGHAIEVGAMLI
jgi:methionyl-tRNA formyltransferase